MFGSPFFITYPYRTGDEASKAFTSQITGGRTFCAL
jgi:hypothetical protein